MCIRDRAQIVEQQLVAVGLRYPLGLDDEVAQARSWRDVDAVSYTHLDVYKRQVLIFTNQLRRSWGEDGVGVDVTTGGNALPFYAATRVELIGRGRMRIVKTRTGTQGALVDLGWCQGAPS